MIKVYIKRFMLAFIVLLMLQTLDLAYAKPAFQSQDAPTYPSNSPADGKNNGLFANAITYYTYSYSNGIAVGDTDRDGYTDLVMPISTDLLDFLLGERDGNFDIQYAYRVTGKTIQEVVVDDFDGNGWNDLAATATNQNGDGELLIYGDEIFIKDRQIVPVGKDPIGIVVGDFNGDGIKDFVVANSGSSSLSILLGKKSLQYKLEYTLPTANSPQKLATGDFNGDGNLDVAVKHADSNQVSVLYGTGDGSFEKPILVAVTGIVQGITAFDSNGDGRTDLVISSKMPNEITVLMDSVDGTFEDRLVYPMDKEPGTITFGDFNGDGNLDLAVAYPSANKVSVMLWKAGGFINDGVDYPVGNKPSALVAYDFNKDGLSDLAVINELSQNVMIFLANSSSKTSIEYSTENFRTLENSDKATITVVRKGDLSEATTVDYYTENGSAKADVDYFSVNGSLIFEIDETEKSFELSIIDDAVYRGDRTVKLNLRNPSGDTALGAKAKAILTITDDEMPPDTEGPKWPKGSKLTGSDITLTSITLNWGAATDNVAVKEYKIYNGTDLLGIVDQSTLLYHVAGLSPKTSYPFKVIAVDAAGNQSTELKNTLTTFSEGNFQFEKAAYSALINSGKVIITVSRGGGTTGEASIRYATSNGTAKAGTDYTATSGTLNFGNGESVKSFEVKLKDNAVYSEDKTVNMKLSTASQGATIGTQATAILTIVDEVLPPPDTVSPEWPSDSELIGTNIMPTSLTLNWPAATDNVAVEKYELYNGQDLIGRVNHNNNYGYSYQVTSLSPDTNYTFKVIAIDKAGNTSTELSMNITTIPVTDPVVGAEAVHAASNHSTIIAGDSNLIDLTIVRSDGSIDTTFNDVRQVTVVGYSIAPNGTGGEFAGQLLNVGETITVNFQDGRASEVLVLNDASLQSISFQVQGINHEESNSLSLKVMPASPESLIILNQPVGPTNEGGGLLAVQPEVQVLDSFGNPVSDIEVRAANKVGSGKWTLTGVDSQITVDGIASFDDLTVTNPNSIGDVTQAIITFKVVGAAEVDSNPFTIIKAHAEPEPEPNSNPNPNPGTNPSPPSKTTPVPSGKHVDVVKDKEVVPADVLTFSDIKDHWARNSIETLAALGVVQGYPDGLFKPDDTITRSEFLVMLVKALKLAPNTSKSQFSDLSNHWAKKWILQAVYFGIANGFSETIFAPDDDLTREQMVTMIMNAIHAKFKKESSLVGLLDDKQFSDENDISTWALTSIRESVYESIIIGYEDGTFRPQLRATRAEAATVIAGIITRLINN